MPDTRVEVAVAAEGVTVAGDAKRVVTVKSGESVEVRWAIAAPRTGQAKLSFRAHAGAESDAVQVAKRVDAPPTLETVALYGADERRERREARRPRADARRRGRARRARRVDGARRPRRRRSSSSSSIRTAAPSSSRAASCRSCRARSRRRRSGSRCPRISTRSSTTAIGKILEQSARRRRLRLVAGLARERPVGDGVRALGARRRAEGRAARAGRGDSTRRLRWLRGQDEPARGDQGGRPRGAGVRPRRPRDDRQAGPGLRRTACTTSAPTCRSSPGRCSLTRWCSRRWTARRRDELLRDLEQHLRMTPSRRTVVDQSATTTRRCSTRRRARRRSSCARSWRVDPKHALAPRLARGLLGERRGGAWRSTQETAWALLALDDYRASPEAGGAGLRRAVFLGERRAALDAPFHGRGARQQRDDGVRGEAARARASRRSRSSVDGKGVALLRGAPPLRAQGAAARHRSTAASSCESSCEA